MNGLTQAQRDYDSRIPCEAVIVDVTEYDAERQYSNRPPVVTDADVENFILLLVASKNVAAFLEDEVGMLPNAHRECAMQIAVARQWVKDINQVGDIIGPVFWQWAKGCALDIAKRQSFESRLN